MLEDGQIEPSDSAWSAPTVLVTKKDRNTRFCVNYRRLNASTKKDTFRLPRIDDSLNSLSGQSLFSTLDLASGYWPVKLSKNAKPKKIKTEAFLPPVRWENPNNMRYKATGPSWPATYISPLFHLNPEQNRSPVVSQITVQQDVPSLICTT